MASDLADDDIDDIVDDDSSAPRLAEVFILYRRSTGVGKQWQVT